MPKLGFNLGHVGVQSVLLLFYAFKVLGLKSVQIGFVSFPFTIEKLVSKTLASFIVTSL